MLTLTETVLGVTPRAVTATRPARKLRTSARARALAGLRLTEGMQPAGITVTSFAQPSELDH
jgi:hypothetical protein